MALRCGLNTWSVHAVLEHAACTPRPVYHACTPGSVHATLVNVACTHDLYTRLCTHGLYTTTTTTCTHPVLGTRGLYTTTCIRGLSQDGLYTWLAHTTLYTRHGLPGSRAKV